MMTPKNNDKPRYSNHLQVLAESLLCKWVEQTEEKLPKLLPSVGSACIPRTTNAILVFAEGEFELFWSSFFKACERFFRAFNQFYKKRCGFFTVTSARRELIFFLLMYVFIRQPESGKAPIEAIMPDATEMPLYKLINDPLRTVMGVEDVNRNVKMADSELLLCA